MATIKLKPGFASRVSGRYGKYEFQVGILTDRPHFDARPASAGLSRYAGGPTRKKSRRSSQSVSKVSKKLRRELGVNFYTAPFKARKNRDILAFSKEFFKLVQGRSQPRRTETLLQAIVRNPMLRGDYGSNSPLTAKIKGFNRLTIDTGQLFKSITARAKRRVSK